MVAIVLRMRRRLGRLGMLGGRRPQSVDMMPSGEKLERNISEIILFAISAWNGLPLSLIIKFRIVEIRLCSGTGQIGNRSANLVMTEKLAKRDGLLGAMTF
jgi:hypothetical protein